MSLLEQTPVPRAAPPQPITSAETFRSRLRALFLECFDGSSFSMETFFSLWFQTHGAGYLFLFKKNLRVTNIQFAELLALIRCHFTDRRTTAGFTHLQFLTIQDFEDTFGDVLESFLSGDTAPEEAVDRFVTLYSGLLERIVIVQPFFGSCTVFVPAHLALDLFAICAYSGYVHSCGPLLYLADIAKATPALLLEALETHVQRYPLPNGKKRKLIIYTHEDFQQEDGDGASVRHGLADVRIYIEKFYIGGLRLVDLPGVVESRCPDVTPVGVADFQKKKTENWREPQTLWLISDRAMGATLEHPGPSRYYFCYEQTYKNENQFHIFDESKPAWRASVTIPHTLAGAMLNVTRPNWPKGQATIDLGEPFAGSGTLCIEATKYPQLAVDAGDKDSITPMLVHDNLHFFSMSSRQLEGLLRHLDQIEDGAFPKPRFIERGPTRRARLAYKHALELLDGLTKRRRLSDLEFDDPSLELLAKMGWRGRFMFYLVLRAALRNESAFFRGTEGWTSAFRRECQAMQRQIRRLRKVRQEQEALVKAGPQSANGNGVCSHPSRFSLACSISTQRADKPPLPRRMASCAQVRDVRDLPAGSYDVIITDPPYGFNTDEAPRELATLYSEALYSMIRALRTNGQLMICLPARAYTGRQTPAFIQPSFVTRQVIVQADIQGREAMAFQYYPISPSLQHFRPPFYWESDRSLRRGIAHFVIR